MKRSTTSDWTFGASSDFVISLFATATGCMEESSNLMKLISCPVFPAVFVTKSSRSPWQNTLKEIIQELDSSNRPGKSISVNFVGKHRQEETTHDILSVVDDGIGFVVLHPFACYFCVNEMSANRTDRYISEFSADVRTLCCFAAQITSKNSLSLTLRELIPYFPRHGVFRP